MSTNINTIPDVKDLETILNNLYRQDFESGQNTQSVGPQTDAQNNDVATQPFGYGTGASIPESTSGSGGISPSAVNQNNAVNLSDPQTTFPDPNAGYVAASSVTPKQQHNTYEGAPSFLKETNYQKLSSGATFNGDIPYFSETISDFSKAIEQALNYGSLATNSFPQSNAGYNPAFYFEENFKQILPQTGFDNYATIPNSNFVQAPFDLNKVRNDFPILKEQVNGLPLIWLDNAATTQKPIQVINRLTEYYTHENSNIHRAAHTLAARATDAYEEAREIVRSFINAKSVNEIVFVRGTTEGINLVAGSWGEQNLHAGDEIIISHLEHHANIVPWQLLAKKKGLQIKVIPVDENGELIIEQYYNLFTNKTKLVSVTAVSNALGTVNPIEDLIKIAHAKGAKILIDAAQSIAHSKTDVQQLDADWLVFSGHKIYGPTGIGVVYGKEDILNSTIPYQSGGNMIKDVTFEQTLFNDSPTRFEAGTANIADAVGLGAALKYVSNIGIEAIHAYETALIQYTLAHLKNINNVQIIGNPKERAGAISFIIKGIETATVGKHLADNGIAVRSGHHCAQPILRKFGLEASVRPSFAFYNNCADIDALIKALHKL